MRKRPGNKNDVSRRSAPTPTRGPAENGGGTSTAGRPDSLEDEIRLRAYHRYLGRETGDGDAMTDWLEAETDVLGRRATGVEAAQRARSDEEAGS